MTPPEAIAAVLAEFGNSPTALAREIGGEVKRQNVEQWVLLGRVPPTHCPAVERIVEGRITADQLCAPDQRWARIKDKAWPWHPQGRPVLDVAKMVA